MTLRMTLLIAVLSLTGPAWTQTNDDTEGPRAIDACGVLVQGAGCVLFEGAGGSWVVPDAGRFDFGDAVRIVGTADPDCITICPDADGCIRGAVLYDPLVFPCGTPLPSFPDDLVTGLCESLGGALVALPLAGMWCTRPGRRARRPQRLGSVPAVSLSGTGVSPVWRLRQELGRRGRAATVGKRARPTTTVLTLPQPLPKREGSCA